MMADDTEPKLQPLRLTAGWQVGINKFLEFDPVSDDVFEALGMRDDTIFTAHHERRNRLMDLGWYPPDEPDGYFWLRVFEGDHLGSLLYEAKCKTRLETVEKMETLFHAVTVGVL